MAGKKSTPPPAARAVLHELGRDALSVFLYVSFTGKELLAILKKLGVEYPGHRIEGLGKIEEVRSRIFAALG